MNITDILAFLKELRAEGTWTLTAIPVETLPGARLPTIRAKYLDDPALSSWLREHWNCNLYYQANPTREVVKKATRADILGAEYAHVDVDRDSVTGKLLTDPEAMDAAYRQFATTQIVPKPTFVVGTGNGLQALWRIDWGNEPPTLDRLEGINRALIDIFGGDKGTWSAAQLLRLPYTVNRLTAAKVKKGIKVDSQSELLSWRPQHESAKVEAFPFIRAEELNTPCTDDIGDAVLVDLDELAREYNLSDSLVALIEDGSLPDDPTKSRSEWLFKCLCDLRRAGVPEVMQKGILLDPLFGISESVVDGSQRRTPEDYANRQIRRARQSLINDAVEDFRDRPIPEYFKALLDRPEPTSGLPGVCTEEGEARGKWHPWTIDEMEEEPPTPWIVENVIPENGSTVIFGPSQEYKTFVALRLAVCVAMGLEFNGTKCERRKVFYVVGEGQDSIKYRVRALMNVLKIEAAELNEWFRVVREPVLLDDLSGIWDGGKEGQVKQFCVAMKAWKPIGLFFFDTVNRNMTGDESQTVDMSRFVKGMDTVREVFGAAAVMIHHTGHDKTRERGSSALRAAVDTMFKVSRNPKRKDNAVFFYCDKNRDGPSQWTRVYKPVEVIVNFEQNLRSIVMVESDGGEEAQGTEAYEMTKADETLLAVCELVDGWSVRSLAAALGIKSSAAHARIKKLREEGWIDDEKQVTEKGLEHEAFLRGVLS